MWVILAAGLVLILAYPAWRSWRRRGEQSKEPTWSLFLFGSCVLAWVLAFAFGSFNYTLAGQLRIYEQLYYYVDVNPSQVPGREVQDAGRLFFAAGSHVDVSKAMSFKAASTYCVAPVVSNVTVERPSFDFWAVGLDCCGTQGSDFRCGADLHSRKAAAGLRDLDEGPRGYYRLAVQSAEASYNIRAEHPVFLLWMPDPVSYLTAGKRQAGRRLLVQTSIFAVCQFFAVTVAAMVFAKAHLSSDGPSGID
jgi:hypothetical protein